MCVCACVWMYASAFMSSRNLFFAKKIKVPLFQAAASEGNCELVIPRPSLTSTSGAAPSRELCPSLPATCLAQFTPQLMSEDTCWLLWVLEIPPPAPHPFSGEAYLPTLTLRGSRGRSPYLVSVPGQAGGRMFQTPWYKRVWKGKAW